METKKYWQAMDKDKSVGIFTSRPVRNEDDGGNYEIDEKTHGYRNIIYTFPIPLKPLQIAEITVNENGTWSWEIEREEGWYMAKRKVDEVPFIMLFVQGEFRQYGNDKFINTEHYKISHTRIPDECII